MKTFWTFRILERIQGFYVAWSVFIVVFDIQQKGIEKKLKKLNIETVLIWYLVFFSIFLAVAQVQTRSTFIYHHLKTTAAPIPLTCLIWTITSPTEKIASTSQTKTSSDVMYILALWKLTTPKSRAWSRDLTSYSEPIQCYSHSDWLPSEWSLVNVADKFHRFGAVPYTSAKMSSHPWFHPNHSPPKTHRTSALLLSSIS